MKNIFVCALALIFGTMISSCESEDMVYQGDAFVQFADTAAYFPVTPNPEQTISVVLGTSNVVSYDRTFGIEVLVDESNARLGQHFELLDSKVVIPANSSVGTFRIKAYHNNLPAEHEKIFASFAFLSDKGEVMPVYGNKTKLYFFKHKDFVVSDFEGYMQCICTFPFSSNPIVFYLKSDRVDDKSIVLRSWLMDGYDVVVKFDDSNPLDLRAEVPSQPAFGDAFYGKIEVMSTPLAPSTFNTLNRTIGLQLIPYVPRVGSYGLYPYFLRMVSEEEALENMKPSKALSRFVMHGNRVSEQ